jgi:hypothetical protein
MYLKLRNSILTIASADGSKFKKWLVAFHWKKLYQKVLQSSLEIVASIKNIGFNHSCNFGIWREILTIFEIHRSVKKINIMNNI